MLNTWKRPRRVDASKLALPDAVGQVLAGNVNDLIVSGGCLMGNLAGLGQDLAARLAAGRISEEEARSINERIVLLVQAIENVCAERVTPLRQSLPALPVAVVSDQQHDHQH